MWSPLNTSTMHVSARLQRETLGSIQVTTYFCDEIPCQDLNLEQRGKLAFNNYMGYFIKYFIAGHKHLVIKDYICLPCRINTPGEQVRVYITRIH